MTIHEPARSAALRGAPWLAALVALVPFCFATAKGIGVSPDSTQYISAARSLIAGNGLSVYWWTGTMEPLTHFPPLYPLVLAGLGSLGLDPVNAAWLVSGALFAVNVLLVAGLTARAAGGSVGAAMAAGFAVAVANDVIQVHTMAWSEPLFVTLSLLTLAAIARAIERPEWRRVITAALLAALAILTRYTGVALIGAGTLALLFLPREPLRRRVVLAAAFGAASVVPLSIWLVRNLLVGGSASNRELAFHPVTGPELAMGVKTTLRWLAPYFPLPLVRGTLFGIGIGAMTVLLIAVVRLLRTRRFSLTRFGELPRVVAIYVACYGLFLVASISFADKHTVLDIRILSPLLPPAIILVVSVVARMVRDRENAPHYTRAAAIVAGATFAVVHLTADYYWTRAAYHEGLGLGALGIRAREMVDAVRRLPESSRIYSNMPDAIYYLTGRMVMGVPHRASPTSLRVNPRFASELDSIGAGAERGPTYVVYFRSTDNRWFLAKPAEVEARVPLRRVATFPVGFIASVEGGCVMRTAGCAVVQPPRVQR